MRKLIYSTMATLDGFMEGPNQELDWAIIDEELHRFINDQERALGLFIYGRRTYEVMSDFWPTADSDPANPPYIVEYAQIWKNMPLIVFSKTLEQVKGNARLVKGDPIETVLQLKEQPGKDLAVGGANLAAQFMRADLIDEYHLYIQPVILGRGKPMFTRLDDQIKLNLLESRTFACGVVFLRYQHAISG